MIDSKLSSILSSAIDASKVAGEILVKFRANPELKISEKNFRELVSEADLAADKAIVSFLKERYPEAGFLTEEQFSATKDSSMFDGPLWIIDPIDGTVNYIYGHHHVGVSIAYMENRKVLAGVVYLPFLDESFCAVKGTGAFLNGERLAVRNTKQLKDAIIATGLPYDRTEFESILDRITSVTRAARDIRRIGAASVDLCYVAAGRLDAYYEGYLKPWDLAAGKLIASEAGAVSGFYVPRDETLPEDLDGGGIIVSSPGIFEELQKVLCVR